ncbi:FAD-binding protein [Cryomorphaceae bacterium S-15]|uniref:FAD-binding protein n=2 Tax=Acidiluteibacter ferrifornacis TaxID=2692424 RepID=A0A6N9NN47_9FLAO|nr:FAD-binding protein [Acidiluteibacter ferrifornacis]
MPENTSEVSQIMAYCNQHNIAVTPRGAGTGLSGGALAIEGGVMLSTEKLNQILHIDEDNLQVTTEPGVITEVLQNAVKERGLFYPPDPASKGSCFIGGNIAENSGGPKAVKYGVVKDYVLNLELVLPNGEVVWTGANVLKNATGYNLTQLIIGSEGTLGVVTKIVLRLIPHPKLDSLMLVPFNSIEDAASAVSAIFKMGVIPSAMELMERDAILMAQKFINDYSLELDDQTQAHLLIEVDGNEDAILMSDLEKIFSVVEQFDCGEVLIAENEAQKNNLWRLRRVVGEAVKKQSIYKEEDTVVPRASLPELLKKVKLIGAEYGFRSVCYGHAGDGNLHINILKDSLSDEFWNTTLNEAIRKLFSEVSRLGGTISGEHGIGYVQRDFLDIVFSSTQIELMKGIKNVFDPNGIMNPKKIWK